MVEQSDENGNHEEWILESDGLEWESGMVSKISVKLPIVSGEIYLYARRKRDLSAISFANYSTKDEKVLLGYIIKEKEGIC